MEMTNVEKVTHVPFRHFDFVMDSSFGFRHSAQNDSDSTLS
jgi:hypothetical protein